MKGIIFNLVEEVVTTAHGADAWDAVLAGAGLEGAYTSLGSYPDEDLTRLVAAASEALGVPADAVVRTIGVGAMPLLAEALRKLLRRPHHGAVVPADAERDHPPRVRKLPRGHRARLHLRDVGDDVLIGYRPSGDCALAEGFILGAADHYGGRRVVSARMHASRRRRVPDPLRVQPGLMG